MPSKQKLQRLRQEAERELGTVKVSSLNEKLELDAASSQVMHQSETFEGDEGRIGAYYLTQIVRNPSGEYFLLKTTGKNPYVQHLPQEHAKLLLKSQYLLPSQ